MTSLAARSPKRLVHGKTGRAAGPASDVRFHASRKWVEFQVSGLKPRGLNLAVVAQSYFVWPRLATHASLLKIHTFWPFGRHRPGESGLIPVASHRQCYAEVIA